MSNECRLVDATGMTVAVGTRGQMMYSLKRHSPDGEYAVVGPGIDAKFYKIGGVVNPAGGHVDSWVIPARTRDESVEAFSLAVLWNDVEYIESSEAYRRSEVLKATLYDRLAAAGISIVQMYYHSGYEDGGAVVCPLTIDTASPNGSSVELPPDLLHTLDECFTDLLPDGWELAEGAHGVMEFNVAGRYVNINHSQDYPQIARME
jgi:hypothetical protein